MHQIKALPPPLEVLGETVGQRGHIGVTAVLHNAVANHFHDFKDEKLNAVDCKQNNSNPVIVSAADQLFELLVNKKT